MRLCKYRNVLGEPNKGFHARRLVLFGTSFALWDVVGTFAIALITYRTFGLSLPTAIILWFAMGVLLHWVFCVDTPLNKLILG